LPLEPNEPGDCNSAPGTASGAARRRAHSVRIEIRFRTMLLAGVAVGLFAVLIVLWPILVTTVVGLMILGMLAPPVAWLERKGLPRGWAIAAVVFGIGVSTTLLLTLTVPRVASQLSDMVGQLPAAQAELASRLDSFRLTAPFAQSIRSANANDLIAKAGRALFAHSTAVAEVVAYGVTAFFLALYLMIDRDRMRGAGFALVSRRYHVRLSRVLLKLEEIVGDYLRGQVLTSLLAGAFTFAVLSVFRVPNAMALAGFAALADILPYVGAALACAPAALAAIPRGAPVALGVLLALACYQSFESRVIVPRIYGRALRLPAAVVMLSLLVGGKLMGILGALLALPMAAGIRMVVEELRVELPGDRSDNSRIEARDRAGERTFEDLTAGASPEKAAAVATEIAETQIAADHRAGKVAERVKKAKHGTHLTGGGDRHAGEP
jgi:putative heme transporter